MPDLSGCSVRYQLVGEVARGGIGAILEGRDIDLGRDLAIKVILEEHRDVPEIVRRFVEEAQIGGQLQHPGIVPVYELGRFPDGRLYIAMKLVEGARWPRFWSRAGVRLTTGRVHLDLREVCQTMAYAYSRGAVHRDLKPSNVMVGSFGEVQVMDWGLAKVLDQGGVADELRARRGRDDATAIRTIRARSLADSRTPARCWGRPPTWPLNKPGRDRHGGRAGRRVRPGLDPLRDLERPAPLHGQDRRRRPPHGPGRRSGST